MLTKFLAISFSTFLVSRHLGKGLFKLFVDRLELLLLGHQLVLKAVHLVTVYENYQVLLMDQSHKAKLHYTSCLDGVWIKIK